ncbi:MAG: Acyltransferase [Chitinophagaceae bacterium]|nr:Acyltransferase [Chitinophagaceae bacterium]
MMIFCRKIIVNNPAVLKMKGPLLLACNHPNSFLDGIILDILFEQPTWALARGDVFKKPFYIKLLTSIKLLPVYRNSEGTENLGENYKTFDDCINIFKEKGIVQIFSEGKCINEWHLRPLRKGTARLAFNSWEKDIPLQVIPVGINYSAFRKSGKNIFINFGGIISGTDMVLNHTDGKKYQEFNDRLKAQLETLVLEIDRDDIIKQKKLLEKPPTLLQKIVFAIPAVLGFIIHAPLYIPIKNFVWKRCNHNDHFDSVLAALLFFAYPVYLLSITLVLFIIFKTPYVFLLLLVIPFTAWCYMLLKKQLDD